MQDHHILTAHQGKVLVVLHDGAPRPVGGHAGEILAKHRIIGTDPHQGEQGRCHVDLADDARIFLRRYALAHDNPRDMEAGNGHQTGATDPAVVVGDDQKQRVFPVLRISRLFEELADGVIRILGRVVAGLLGLLIEGDAIVGKFERIVVAGAEHQAEEGLALFVQPSEGFVSLGHQVLVGGAP